MEENKNQELTESQTYSVMQFAQSMMGYGLYTPQLSHQLLLDLNVNPLSTNYDKIAKALDNAKNTVEELQGYSQWMEYNDMIYNRLVKYYTGLLSFNKREYCVNASEKDYGKKEYKEDVRRRKKFFERFNYQEEFEKALLEVLRTGVCFCWLRTNKGSFSQSGIDPDDIKFENTTKYTLQMLPQKYCLLTGYFEQGLLFDFDLVYFLKVGSDLSQYDPSLIEAYKSVMIDNDRELYYPTRKLARRDGSWAYWTQTSPDNGAICIKYDQSNFLAFPPLAPLMKSAVLNTEIQSLQRDKDIQSAYAILSGEIKMLDNQKSGEVKNAFAISPDVLGHFMNLVQSGMKKNIKSVALPLDNAKWHQYTDNNPNMAISQVNSTVSQGAGASRTIYSTDKMSQAEIENAIYNDYMFVEHLYSQFENVLNFYVNKKTRKYKFRFKLAGLNRPFAQEKDRESIQELIQVGITPSISTVACAYGYTSEELEASIQEAKGTGMYDNQLLLQTVNTQSGKSEGRPRKKGTKSTESGEYDNSNE